MIGTSLSSPGCVVYGLTNTTCKTWTRSPLSAPSTPLRTDTNNTWSVWGGNETDYRKFSERAGTWKEQKKIGPLYTITSRRKWSSSTENIHFFFIIIYWAFNRVLFLQNFAANASSTIFRIHLEGSTFLHVLEKSPVFVELALSWFLILWFERLSLCKRDLRVGAHHVPLFHTHRTLLGQVVKKYSATKPPTGEGRGGLSHS